MKKHEKNIKCKTDEKHIFINASLEENGKCHDKCDRCKKSINQMPFRCDAENCGSVEFDTFEEMVEHAESFHGCVLINNGYPTQKTETKCILTISKDDIRIKAKEMKTKLSESQVQEIFDRFDTNDVMMGGFWELLNQMIEEQ